MPRSCLRRADILATVVAVPLFVSLWLTGRQSWIAAATAIIVPLYLAAERHERRRSA